MFVPVHASNACKVKIPDHLWLPFIDQLQSDEVVFSMIYFYVYKYLVTKWKHGISINGMEEFNG